MSCEKLFLKHLRERGLRFTPQREMVLAVMHQIERLATAEEVYARVRNINSSVDISTIYRTLDLLQEFQLVASFDLGDGQRRYKHLGVHGPHLHLVCRSCGEVLGLELEEMQEFTDYLAEVYGFKAELGHATIPGLCRECWATSYALPRIESRVA